jgi:hypothetical protein
MAKRMRRDCGMQEDETLWAIGRGFVVRDLPWTEQRLRKIPPFEFENWAVLAIGGHANKAKVGDKGIDGRIYPVGVTPGRRDKETGDFDFMDVWYPVQVKQEDKVDRPDIDAFETAMRRANRSKGFFVSFDYSEGAMQEIGRFFTKEQRIIIPLTVRQIIDGEIARMLV